MEVYSWGSGNYGRLGLGSSADSLKPQLVSGVLNGYEIAGTACSWYHSAVITSNGDVATFGSKITKCLGTAASGSDASDAESSGDSESDGTLTRASPQQRGRQRPPKPGRQSKEVVHSTGRSTGDFVPHLLRSFPSRVNVVQVAVGSDMLGAHTLAISRNGRLYSWGYGPACGHGTTANVSTPTLVTKFLGTGAGESGSGRQRQDMEPLGWGKHSHMRYRQKISNKNLGLQLLRPKIAKAACGGGFSVVLSSEGEVFTFGVSASGRLGFRTKFRAQLRPRRIETLSEGTTDIAAGAAFVLLCSAAGRLLAWGDNSKGQLGVGHLQESHEPLTLGRACPSAFVMQAVAAGDSHSLALDSAGHTYSWGGEGGPMTGQGQPVPNSTQVDAAFQFRLRQLSHWWVRPHPIRALSGVHIVHIDAGCLHSLALSQDGALYAWGAPLQAATARSGSNVQSVRSEVSWVPRLVAPSPKLPLVRIGTAAAGGWHSMTTAVPSSGLEKLLPPDWFQDSKMSEHDQASQSLMDACDGFLVSEVDSTLEEEVRVPICCAAVRARLAMPDGTDSPIWRALSAQVVRLRPESVAVGTEAETTQEDEETSSSESGGLLEVAEMHRSSQRLSARKLPATARSNDADEAAGLALQPPSKKPHSEAPQKIPPPDRQKRKLVVPTFSSDSDSGDVVSRNPPKPRQDARTAPQVAAPAPKRPVPDFSSDESGSEEELLPDDVVEAAKRSPQSRSDVTPPRRAKPEARPAAPPVLSTLGGLELRNYGEAVLAALVRFLCTDMLPNLTIIDESHPVWQREQQVRSMRSPVSSPEGEDAKRPTRLRAVSGMLLRREVADLRHIGTSLGLERLARLCDQLLLRLDAPGAPALFVPASSIGTTMWTLLRQTLRAPDRDGPDTELLCAPPQPRKQRWGPRWLPKDGHLQAHSFVLCAGCMSLQREQRAPDGPAELAGGGWLGHGSPDVSATSSPMLRLRRRNGGGGGAPRYELDLRHYTADIVFAWLRYLYTQDDLELTWPLRTDRLEAEAAEHWWMQLLQLGQLMGDRKLQLYAQDTLVGAVSNQNWVEMLSFAEQVGCTVLLEAAIMTGLRQLLPHLLASFQVPTGLEGQKVKMQEQPEAAGGVPSGTVEVELERKFAELRGSKQASHAKAMLQVLKKKSPPQFAELKNRLSEAITAAQKSGAQLQRCVEYFDSHEQRGFRREESKGRARVEVAVAVLLLGVFLIPAATRQTIYGAFVTVTEPIKVMVASLDLASLLPFGSVTSYLFALNIVAIFVLLAVVFSILQK